MMIDFNRKPSPKSESEKRFDELNAEYTEKFGEPYNFAIGIDVDTWDEVLADISRRIQENDPKPKPEYDQDLVY